ncbi:DNA cytosine methyltransferase [Actinomadura spongiicola]|uniref:DNA (cytosine-5-)-methyltransferase n=1 Tax=Actinomadura spongiicola TaxID=2303421 RepID=A0A372G807_9ACTN|nr:DNA cytosine methyltransferase [Actinomadura spongiicola]
MYSGEDSVLTSVHLMAGGGGDLAGFALAGYDTLAAVNHLQAAVQTVLLNRPVNGIVEDVSRLDMLSLPGADVLVASPICTEAAPAGGNAVRQQRQQPWAATRATAWCLIRYAEIHRPAVIVGENVLRFARWDLFEPWLKVFEAMNYTARIVPVNAAHISSPGNPAAPQVRERLVFVLARRGIEVDLEVRPAARCRVCGPVQGVRCWKPTATRIAGHLIGDYDPGTGRHGAYYYLCPAGHGRVEPATTAMAPGIDWSLPMRLVADGHRRGPYAPATRARIRHGLTRWDGRPFVAILRRHKLSEPLDGPVATITAAGTHHMLVQPGDDRTIDGCRVRMFTTPEKAYAQRFPDSWKFVTRFPKADRDKVPHGATPGGLLTGNAVPSNIAEWAGGRIKYALTA